MRLVLDTNVVTSALLWSGPPRQLLVLAKERRIELITSMPLLAELTNILERRKFQHKIAASMLTLDEIVERYALLAELVRPDVVPRTAPDPDDDVVLGTARAGAVHIIVSGDKHLLSMRTFEDLPILKPSEAIERVVR